MAEIDLVSSYDSLCVLEASLHLGLESEFLKFVQSQQREQVEFLQIKEELRSLKLEHELTLEELAQWKNNYSDLRNSGEKKRKELESTVQNMVEILRQVKEIVSRDRTLADQTKEFFTKLDNYEELHSQSKCEPAEFDKSAELLEFEPAPILSPARKRTSSAQRTLGDGLLDTKQLKMSSQDEVFVTATTINVPDKGVNAATTRKLDLARQESVPAPPPVDNPDNSQKYKRRSHSEPEPLIGNDQTVLGNVYFPALGAEPSVQSIPLEYLFPQSSSSKGFQSSTPRIQDRTILPARSNSGSKLKRRAHEYVSKTVFKPETCSACGRRVKFSKQALKCHNCHITCHPECKSTIQHPCIPVDRTPNKVGKTVSDYAPAEPPHVPFIIAMCTSEIEARGMNETGLYRISAPEKDIAAIREKFYKSKSFPNLKNVSVHVLCGTIKNFLRQLEPLIPKLTWKEFAAAAEKTVPEECQSAFCQCIRQLPLPNRDTLAFLILHWHRVAAHPSIKMPMKNLALVLGPTVVGFSSQNLDAETMIMEQSVQVKVMEKLLTIPVEFWKSYVEDQRTSLYLQDAGILSPRTIGSSRLSPLNRTRTIQQLPTKTARFFTSPQLPH